MSQTIHYAGKKYNLDKLRADVTSKSFWRFVQEFWGTIPGAGILIPNWHMEVISNELQEAAERVFRGEPKQYDLLINQPPGSSKSTIASILFLPWTWSRMPNARHLNASHTDMLCLDLSNKTRECIRGEKYQACFPHIQLSKDQDTKGYFRNTLGGDRLTCTVGGKSPIGFHAHFLGLDDLLDPKKARSELETRAAEEFLTEILPSRKVDKSISFTYMVMQRLSGKDPTAVWLDSQKNPDAARIRHIRIPATDDWTITPIELKRYYVDGLMDPNRLSRKSLREMEVALGSYGYSAQFGEDPCPLSGGMFKAHYFSQRKKSSPFNCKRIRFWDRASLDSGGCRTAGTLLGIDENDHVYIEHVVAGQWEPTERNQVMRATALRDRLKYGPKYEPTIYTEAEGGSSGKDAFKGVARALLGFRVLEDRPTGEKEVRAEPWAGYLGAMNVWIIDNGASENAGTSDWDINLFVDEHVNFPLGRFKDQVDSAAACFNLLIQSRRKAGMSIHRHIEIKKNQIRFIVCNEEELKSLVLDQSCIIIRSFGYHEHQEWLNNSSSPPEHALVNLQGFLDIWFEPFSPEDFQSTWNEKVTGYDLLPEQLIMTRDHGKKIWNFILKKFNKPPQVFLFLSNDEKNQKAMSLSMSVCDVMRLPRRTTIYQPSNPDAVHDGKAMLVHVYDMTKASRSLVMG